MRRSTMPGYGSPEPARPWAAAAAAACLAVLLAACGPPPAPPDAGSATASAPTASAGGTATGTAAGTSDGTAADPVTGTAVPPSATVGAPPGEPSPSASSPSRLPSPTASGWKTFTTPDGDLMFDYPGDWTIKDPRGKSPLGGAFAEVVNAAGKTMALLETRIVTGSECVQKYPFAVLDSEPMTALAEKGVADDNAPRFMFETRGDALAPARTAETIAAYGITMIPEEAGTLACPIFLLFRWPPSGAMFGAGYDPANNATPGNPSLPYWERAKLYAETGEYRNIRRMITSLRPAR